MTQQTSKKILDCLHPFEFYRNRHPHLLSSNSKYKIYFPSKYCQIWYLSWKSHAVVVPSLKLAAVVSNYEEALTLKRFIDLENVTDISMSDPL